MEDKHTTGPSPEGGGSGNGSGGIWPFVIGLVVALIFGWGLFPSLMHSEQPQPVAFSHQTHVVGASVDCAVCHYVRADGSFSGIPTLEDCKVCHIQKMGDKPEEEAFLANYVRTGQEVKWAVYQKQPDNVYFSHARHSIERCNTCHTFSERTLCAECHLDVAGMDKAPAFAENRLTGYGKDTTMKMWRCERCHANPNHINETGANNACFVCHK